MSKVQQTSYLFHQTDLDASQPDKSVSQFAQTSQVLAKQQDMMGKVNQEIKMANVREETTKIKKDSRQKIIQSTQYSSPIKGESLQSNTSQQDLWKADNEFSTEIIKWNHYFLVPNPKSTAKNFQCGLCKCIFLKIVEFTHHCFLVCGEIYHAQSSHFIISGTLMSNTLYKTIKSGQMNIIEGQSRNIQTKSLRRKINGRYCSTKNINPKLISKMDIKQFKSNQPNAKFISIEKPKIGLKKHVTQKNQSQWTQNRQIKTQSILAKYRSTNNQILEKDHRSLSKPKKHVKNKEVNKEIPPLTQQKLEEFVRQKTNRIKKQSKTIIQMWKQKQLQTQFVLHKNYRPFYPSFVFLLNPLRNIVTVISDECDLCVKNYWKINFRMADHFMEKCCEINKQESTYLILWSEDFYEYNFERSENHYKNNLDLAYWKYIYQKTPLINEIDSLYPKFKYHLGYIQSYIFAHSITGVCLFCKFVRPAQFIQASKPKHKETCILYNSKKDYIRLSREQNHRFFNRDLLNVEMVQQYTFFCPCKSYEEQFGADELIEHLQSAHPSRINISLQAVFQKQQYSK